MLDLRNRYDRQRWNNIVAGALLVLCGLVKASEVLIS